MLLKAMGCEHGQGYFFSKPLNSEAATLFLRQQVQTHAQTQGLPAEILHKYFEKVWKSNFGAQQSTSPNSLINDKTVGAKQRVRAGGTNCGHTIGKGSEQLPSQIN